MSIRVGMAQTLVEGGRPGPNLDRAVAAIESACELGCRLVVLPECLDLGWTDPSARELAVPIPGPHFVLPPAGIQLDAFGPDLVALAWRREPRGRMPGIAADGDRRFRIGFQVVVPGRMLGTTEVGGDEAYAVRMRDAVHGDGAWFTGFGADGGEYYHGDPRRDRGEAAPATGGFADEPVEVVSGRAKKRRTYGGGSEAAHRPMKGIRFVK